MYYNYSTEKRLMTNSLYEDEGRDWKEDFQYDNGQYFKTCRSCRHTFIGHKRRVVCKKCVTTPATEQHAFENPMPDLNSLKPGELANCVDRASTSIATPTLVASITVPPTTSKIT